MNDIMPYSHGSDRRKIATAQWMPPNVVAERFPYTEGDFWLGRDFMNGLPIGYKDDRHICLVSGNRGGKGTTTIIPNILLWPGSIVVIDPKGENASVCAARRGEGSDYCSGLNQHTFVLDPFHEATVDDKYRAKFNPLDAIDPNSREAIDESGRLADAIVTSDNEKDVHWDESAKALIKALILFVLTDKSFEGKRNLSTVRSLLQRGEQKTLKLIKKTRKDNLPSAQLLLWEGVRRSPHFGGVLSGMGESFYDMFLHGAKEYNSVRSVAIRNTVFLDSPGMKEVLSKSDFKLSDLKTEKEGVSLFLTLPTRYLGEHFRWLRLMTSLITTEMEKTKGLPATGHRVLMCLDEFASLRKLRVIEDAVAQIAGSGVKLFFVLQSLEQLKKVYNDGWETFLANASLKIFYSIDDQFTRDYVSKQAGDEEVIIDLETESFAEGEQHTNTEGSSEAKSETESSSISRGETKTNTKTHGKNSSFGHNSGAARGNLFNIGDLVADSISNTFGGNVVKQWGQGKQSGRSKSRAASRNDTTGNSIGSTNTTNQSFAEGRTKTQTRGKSQSIHVRPLIRPEEVGKWFSRIDNEDNPLAPGAALVMISGQNSVTVRKSNYYEDEDMRGLFDPHPDHGFVPYLEPVEDEKEEILSFEEGISWINSITPSIDESRKGAPDVMAEVKRLYPISSKKIDFFKAEVTLDLPIELIWYHVLNFEQYPFWQYGHPKYYPPLPDPFYVGVNLNPDSKKNAKDRFGNPFFLTVFECWGDKANNDDVRYFAAYTGYGYAFNLKRETKNQTTLKYYRSGYIKTPRIISMFQKQTTFEKLSRDEFNNFVDRCKSSSFYPKEIQPWIKSILKN